MTTMRWNSGVATVLAVLLTTALAATGASSASAGSTAAQADPAVRTGYAPEDAASVAVHRIVQPLAAPNRIDVDVEALRGVLVTDGSLPGVIELLLTGTRIPTDMARQLHPASGLVHTVTFATSAWGRENEAQITIETNSAVSVSVDDLENHREITLSSRENPSDRFVIRLRERAYPLAATPALKEQLKSLSTQPVEGEMGAWWAPAGSQPSLARAAVTPASLTAVRDARVSLPDLQGMMFAAQNENATGSQQDSAAEAPSAGEAPAAEAPASEEVKPEGEKAEEAPAETVEETEPPVKRMPKAPNTVEANKELSRQMIAGEQRLSPEIPEPAPKKAWSGDPLAQPVTIDFRDMDLLNVVQILADMAGINVVAGADLAGPVTLNLRNVPLMQAMETALRLNGLGIVEEEGIYHIKPYLDAISAQRVTEVVDIEHAEAEEIVATLENVIQGSEYEALISFSSNKTANTVIIAGPEAQIGPLVTMAKRLDVEQATLPTVTLPVKLNYADPGDILASIEGIVTPEVGKVSVDERARMLVVTDIPIVVEKIKELVAQLDIPVKQVAIDAMIVDVTLTDAADTGVDWIVSAVQSQSRRDAALGTGINTGNLQDLSLSSVLDVGETAGLLNFGILSGDIDWRGVIQAEVRNNNSTLLSNPKLITVENQTATITIASEIPYTELTSTEQGGQQTSTEFKPIGTTLEVTPKVTHDDHIIAQIVAKESTSSQVVNGVPVEDLRQIDTTPHIASGQTIYVGGLRKNNDTVSIRKVPVLGDVPVVNFLFRSNQRNETVNELLIFLTCSVVEDTPALTGYQQEQANRVRNAEVTVNAETALIYDAVNPEEMRDPAWKWRRNHGKAKTSIEASEPAE